MPRTRYTPEEKANALRLCDEIGVPKASEQTGISVHSLYKWRTGIEDEASQTTVEGEVAPAEQRVAGEGVASLGQENNASLRKRYTAKEKGSALRLCEKIGITKASKKTGITINSLRKWRAEAQNQMITAETPVHKETVEPDDSQADTGSESTAIVARLTKASSEELLSEDSDLPKVLENINTDAKTNDADVLATKLRKEEDMPLPVDKDANMDERASEELVRLRIENSTLKAQILSLKSALRVFTE